MARFEETETAVIARLRALKAAPEVTINQPDVAAPMIAAGFDQEEIMAVLIALEQDKILSFTVGNRLLILKNLPD
ncbi:hypothetical protein G6L08_08525 [Agrobacterium rhizogenes]|nr:hypothetical protein [Rhizobium rhizogenes]